MTASDQLNTPVLFLIFNRPDPTRRVFDEIRKVKPRKIYIAADGPRSHKAGEKEKCERTRSIVTRIDWECDVKTLFRDTNLGCKNAVSSAITWFFEQEEQGIILEDDCLPDPSFFGFCEQLLQQYKTDSRVMHIGGNNFLAVPPTTDSYYFSNYNHIWGWATWRRAWQKYDSKVTDFPEFMGEDRIKRIFGSDAFQYSWLYKFWKVYRNKIDTWDYQWTYTIWNNAGISITPAKNLVSNIGFDQDATHTKNFNTKVAEIGTRSITQIVHPREIRIDQNADRQTEILSFNRTPLKNVVFWLMTCFIRLKFRMA